MSDKEILPEDPVSKKEPLYLEWEGYRIPITEKEAQEIAENPEAVYEVIIRHKRKFPFNTAEDNMNFITWK